MYLGNLYMVCPTYVGMNHFERSPPGAERGMPNIGGDEPVKKLLIIYAPVCPTYVGMN